MRGTAVCRVLFFVCLLLLTQGSESAESSVGCGYHCFIAADAPPLPGCPLLLRGGGDWPDGCAPAFEAMTVRGRHIALRFRWDTPPGPCPTVITHYEQDCLLHDLTPGLYTFDLYVNDSCCAGGQTIVPVEAWFLPLSTSGHVPLSDVGAEPS